MTIIWCMTPEIWGVTDNIFCHFELFLALLTLLTTWKIKILKNWKKLLVILSFYTSVLKIMTICYTVPEIWRMKYVIIFHFGPFFAPLPPKQPEKSKFKKMKKTLGDINILHKCTKNHDHMLHWDKACGRCHTDSKIILAKHYEDVKCSNTKYVHKFRDKPVVNFIYNFFFICYFCFVSFIFNFTFFALESSGNLAIKYSAIFMIALR